MYRKLTAKELEPMRKEYRENSIYQIIYTPVSKQSKDDLIPEEVWEEANNWAFRLKQQNDDNCRIHVTEGFNDLCSRYTEFVDEKGDIIKRDCEKAYHSAMMVSFVTCLLLAATHDVAENHPYGEIIVTIVDLIGDIPGYKDLEKDTEKEEDLNERKNKYVRFTDCIIQIKRNGSESENTLKKDTRGPKLPNDIFEKQGDICNLNKPPLELQTDKANVLWKKLREAGFIVVDGYALAEGISNNQAAYIADCMAGKLQIKNKWKAFDFWGIPNMAQLAGTWKDTGKLPPRANEIDKIME